MPSFDAPIRIDCCPDWRWPAGEIALTVLGAAVAIGAILSTFDGLLALPLAVLIGLFGAHQATRVWQAQRCARSVSLWLHADGELRGTLADGSTVLASQVELDVGIAGLFTLRGQHAVTGGRRPFRVHLARRALGANVHRRLCAWHRAGLPRAAAPPRKQGGE